MIVKALNKAYLLLLMLCVQPSFISRQERDAKYGCVADTGLSEVGLPLCDFLHATGHNFAHMLTIEETFKLLLA